MELIGDRNSIEKTTITANNDEKFDNLVTGIMIVGKENIISNSHIEVKLAPASFMPFVTQAVQWITTFEIEYECCIIKIK